VRLQFLLDRIAEKEEVQVTPAQMRDHINRLAPMYGMDAEKLKAELKKKDAMEDVENELRRSLVMDLLVEKANVTEVTGAE
jgi:trigger factor